MRSTNDRYKTICGWCGEAFDPDHGNALYCSDHCRKMGMRRTARQCQRRRRQRLKDGYNICPNCRGLFLRDGKLYCPLCRAKLPSDSGGDDRASMRVNHEGLRACLKCNGRFWSEGPWNRICSACRRTYQHSGRVVHHGWPAGEVH